MQTYDRRSIEEWFSAGKQLCPQTQQALLDTTLIPNHLVRSMILQWCTENRYNLPAVENQKENNVTNSDQKTFDEIFKKITSSPKSTEMRQAIKDLRLITKQNSDFRAVLETGRIPSHE